MPNHESYSFDEYANFENKEQSPALPLKNSPEISQADISSGAYSAVIEIGDNKVAKINRMLYVDNDAILPQGVKEKYLVRKTDDPEVDKKEVISKVIEFAKDKEKTYEMLGSYIGEFLPRLEMFAVIDSPRKEIEARLNNKLPQEILDQIPNTETALMEIWEQVDAGRALKNLGYRGLSERYDDPEYQHQLKKFATATLKLLEDTGTMIDIADGSGIRAITQNGERIFVNSTEEIKAHDTDGTLVYPRNTTLEKGRVKFFDTYPVFEIDPSITKETLDQIKESLRENDFDKLIAVEQASSKPREYQITVQYLYLLKKMGAEL